MTDQTPRPVSRVQRALAFISAGLVVLSLVSFVVLIIGTWLGAGPAQGSGKGIWPTVELLPLVALPIAFVLIIVLLFVSMSGRSKRSGKARG